MIATVIIIHYYGANCQIACVPQACFGGPWSGVRHEVLELGKVTAGMGRLKLFLHMFCRSLSTSAGTISDKAIVGGTTLQLPDQESKYELGWGLGEQYELKPNDVLPNPVL